MKTNPVMVAWALCAVTSFVGVAYAQNAGQDDSSGSSDPQAGAAMATEASSKLIPAMSRASKVIGTEVVSPKGRKLGEVKDIVLDRQRGQVAYAVVAGVMSGAENKYFAVPWKSLQARNDGTMRLNVEPEQMKNAPGFDKDKWPDMANHQWNADVYRFYNQEPYWSDSATAGRESDNSSGTSDEAEGAAGSSGASNGGSAEGTTLTPSHPSGSTSEKDRTNDSSNEEAGNTTDGSSTGRGDGAHERESGAEARSSGDGNQLNEPDSAESSGESNDGQRRKPNEDREQMINRSEQFSS